MTAAADPAPVRGLVPARLGRRGVAGAAGCAGEPVLSAKITAPEVPDWAVERPRVTKLITQGTRWCPLTVVTGPAGAGKTVALACWAAAEPGAVAWVSLDEDDNRPGVFWSCVIAALRQCGVAVPRSWPAGPRGRAGDRVLLLRLASVLAAAGPPVTLVLDDLHLLTDPKLLDGLCFVLRNTGPGLRLVVSSRADPLSPPDRCRLAGRLAEPLTEREREVLHHYASLFSRAEVASEMHLSVNTVKTHLKNIYRKLEATRRAEAVRRARQLDLI